MKAIESDTDVTVRLTLDGVTPACPVDGTPDAYEVTIEYRPAGHVVEIGSVRSWFDALDGVEVTHEALCDDAFETIHETIAPAALRVVVVGEHYGVETEVSRER